MRLEELSVKDMQRGYSHEEQQHFYRCIACGQVFEEGQVYPVDEKLYTAERAVQLHRQQVHGAYVDDLIEDDSKYNALTQNQRNILHLVAAGHTDKEIAQQMEVSPSTVRHQKFMLREKAKQAKLYLATYLSVVERGETPQNAIMPIHDHARMVDDRYVVTEKEREQILKIAFTSLEPLRLKAFSRKEKKKLVILTQIAGQFEAGRQYTEPEVNHILEAVFDDYVTLRRYLIEYGFMQRKRDGSSYWLT